MTRESVRGKKKQKVHVITMGCSKNVVDSEKLMAQLRLNDIELGADIGGGRYRGHQHVRVH